MEVQACKACGTSVSTLDIEEGDAGEIKGVYFCAECFKKIKARASQKIRKTQDAALELIDSPPPAQASSSQRAVRTSASTRQPSTSRRSKRISGRHPPVQTTSDRQPSTSRRSKRISGGHPPVQTTSDRQPSTSRRSKRISSGHPPVKTTSTSKRMRSSGSGPVEKLSSSRITRISSQRIAVADQSTSSSSQLRRTAPSSARIQALSERREAIKSSKSKVVVIILVIVIIGLITVIGMVMRDKKKGPDDATVADASTTTSTKTGEEVSNDTTAAGKENQQETVGLQNGNQQSSSKENNISQEDAALIVEFTEKIEDALDIQDIKEAYTLAVRAKQKFQNDESIDEIHVKALKEAEKYSKRILDDALMLEKENAFTEAEELYSELIALGVPGFKDKAEEKLHNLDNIKTQSREQVKEAEAKSIFLESFLFFNEYMEDPASEDAKESADEAIKNFDLLLEDYRSTTVVRKKKKLIEAARGKLKDGNP